MLFKQTKEHGWQQKDSAVLGHLKECNGLHHITKMFGKCMGKGVDQKELQISNVWQNIIILWRLDNWLKFLESLAIKEHRPVLNTGIKHPKVMFV